MLQSKTMEKNMYSDLMQNSNRDKLFEDLMELLDEAEDECIDNATEIKDALKAANLEAKMKAFLDNEGATQKQTRTIFCVVLGRMVKNSAEPYRLLNEIVEHIRKVASNS